VTPTMFTRRSGAILGVLAVSALLAACGSSSSSSASASSSSPTATTAPAGAAAGAGRARGAALRACLKAHGVTLPNRRPGTGRPPGGTPGGGLFGGGGGRFAANPKLRAALQACGARFGFRGGAGRFRPSTQRVSAFVACVRKHGYPMPSPNLSGTGPVFPASIRTDPKFIAAAKPCESLLVPPGGAAGAPPAGTSTT
jgi:hypothetical protein